MMSNRNHPPKWADKFLEWYCKPELLEEIQGDIYELFDIRVQSNGLKTAQRQFVWDIFRSFRLSTIKNIHLNFSPDMLKSNLKIAWRQLLKQKMYSIIKIGGFALGIAACILIALFIKDEMSYDAYHPDKERIYRAYATYINDDDFLQGSHFPAPMARTLEEEFPEIEMAGRINSSALFDGPGSNQVRPEGSTINNYEEGFVYADQKFLDIFQIPFVYGSRATALAQPNSIVISKSKSDKYFPNEDPVGKTLVLNNDEGKPLTIGGVMEDFPSNSHFQYDFLITLQDVELWPGEQSQWDASNYFVFMKLKENANPQAVSDKLNLIVEKYVAPAWADDDSMTEEEVVSILKFHLQSLSDMHLKSYAITDGQSYGDIRFIWLFGAVALFILILACINFINLSTAKSANRAKEIGLRKVVGSFRSQLINQFLTESVLFSMLSFFLGAIIASWVLPLFNSLADKALIFPFAEWWFIPTLIVAALFIGIIAGIYPAYYLSAFRPATVLKGELSRGSKRSLMRNGLVIFQFTVSIVLIISTIIIYQQNNFILNTKIGFDKDQVILIQGAQTLTDNYDAFKEEVLQLTDVEYVSSSGFIPVRGGQRNQNGFYIAGKKAESKAVYGQFWSVDHDYIDALGMNILEGRNFSTEMPTDSQAIIINQAMKEKFGFDNAVGKQIVNFAAPWEIIGVVDNFHFESLKMNIEPLAMVLSNSNKTISVKVNTADMPRLTTALTATWDKFSPNQPIRYSFLDESFANMYTDVQRTGRIFTSFAILAIIIACLGLFALSAFMAEQRSKEIGIRKVLGASMETILQLLTRNFLRLVLISLIVAIPIGWYLMRKWLEDFVYRIDIRWEVFLIAGGLAVMIALLTVSFQAIRTATRNPVDSLRSE